MRAITICRATAWLGAAVVFWSLNIRWGANPNLPSGPPDQWERWIVGASLLAFVAALAISVSGRKDTPPSWLARGIAAGGALAVLLIAFLLYREAHASGFVPDLLGGSGWMWLVAGAGMVVGAVIGTLGLRAKEPAKKPRRRPGR